MKFGRHFFLLSSILLLFIFSSSFVEARQCDSAVACTPVSAFNYKTFYFGQVQSTKECGDDACAMFWCLVDHKKVMFGAGCYSDYVSICGSVSNNAQPDVKLLFDNKEGVNAKVRACAPLFEDPDCATSWYRHAVDLGNDFFTGKFIKYADMSFDGPCENAVAPVVDGPAPAGVTGSSVMNQMNGFKLFGIILICLMLAQFW